MILDEQSMFSNKQSITQSCASENIINFGKREISFGTPVELFIQISDTFDNLTSLTVAVQTSNEETFSSPTDLIEQTMLLEELKKGAVSSVKFIPKGNLGFIRLYYTVTGENPSKGSIIAAVVDGQQESFHNS